jgi:hypothetical protein
LEIYRDGSGRLHAASIRVATIVAIPNTASRVLARHAGREDGRRASIDISDVFHALKYRESRPLLTAHLVPFFAAHQIA